MKNYDEEIKKLEQQIANLKKEKKEFDLMTPEQKLAIQLHSMNCTWNHTDGCGWFYEIKNNVHNWNGHAHSRYLDQARKVVQMVELLDITTDKAIEIYKTMK